MQGGRAPTVLVLLLVTASLTGCIGGVLEDDLETQATDRSVPPPGTGINESRLTEPVFDVLPQEIAYATSSLDGIELYAEVYLPDGEGPWPTILEMSPYNALRANGGGDIPGFTGDSSLVDTYVPRGYAVVLAHVRGTGNSQGCMDMMGDKEQQDAHDMVEWVADQGWSDGKVAMHGVSYVGTTPHEALITAPEHLTTVVTIAGVTNQWRNTFMNGVPYDGRHYPLTYNAFSAAPPTNVDQGPDWALNAAGALCDQEEAVDAMSPGTYEHGVYTDYWHERNFTLHTGQANASILYSQGFDDRAVNPSEAIYWFNELDVPKKALLHQDGHMVPPREDYATIEHAWLDHWLKGIDNGVMDTPTVEVLTGDDRIRTDTAWPPTDARLERFHMGPGELSPTAPDQGEETYLADQARNAAPGHPGTGTPADGIYDDPTAPAGLPTSLTYTSDPLDEELYLAGEPRMHLVASVDAENTYFIFDLYALDPETGEQDWLGEGWFNAHLREGDDRSAPLTPDEPYAFTFRFEPADQPIPAGQQIQLVLRGHDDRVFPIDQPATENTVFYGTEGSWVELPLLDAPVLFDRSEDI